MNDKLNQTQENGKQKKIELYMPWVYLLAGILLIVASLAIFNSLKPLVENSYNAHAVDTSDPDTLLNHANTYYWWGRYRKNTLPEFDTAAVWAGRALQLAQSRFAQDKDTAAFMQRKLQAEQLIAQARQQADICKYNIASYIPTYMEIMGYDDDYMHEDADPEDVPNIALRGALGRLVDLFSPDKNLPVSSRTSFALVNVKTSNPMADEMLVQELNNKTRMYTIAPHELARIAGNDSTTVSMAVGDSIMMKKIAAAFSTDELAVIDFTENDKVNGIYYYGIRLKIWHAEKGWDSRNVYTEYMIRDRVFNQVTVFIGRLLLVVLLLALAINFILIPLSGWLANMKPVTPYYLLLCCIIAMITQYLMVTFGLKNFLNPTPDAYFVSDPGEQWAILYPLTFILPGFITYLVLGKMDNFISSFQSDFENPLTLFSLVAGSLLPLAFSFTYYQVIRFGFGPAAYALFTIVLIVLFMAMAVAWYWSAIINFPQKIHWAVRLATWLGFVVHIFIAFIFASSLLQNYDNLSIDSWFLTSFLYPTGIIGLVNFLTREYFKKKPKNVSSDVIPAEEQPEDIHTITIETDAVIQQIPVKNEGQKNPEVKKYASLYVRSERGTQARKAVESNLLSKLTDIDLQVIDFNVDKGTRDVHYLPFAKAFEEYLPYIKFNDVAETARKTSNIIGKALSTITSAAGILIDDGQTKPRKPEKVAELLLEKLSGKRTILLLDHIEKIDEENIQLLEELVNAIIAIRQESEKSDKSPHELPLLIAFGTGEFGYRDKVLSLLGKLRREGILEGVLDFKLIFKNASENFLAKQSLPVQVELHLKDLFVRENHDYSPDVVEDMYKVLQKNQVIKKVNFEGEEMQVLSLSDLKQLPDIRKGQDLDEAVHQHTSLKDVLIAAAYLADSEAKFHLPVLAHALKMDRIPLLHLLKEAECYNLVYDLKGKDHFYWYAFTDRGLVTDFKEIENPRQEQVSQLANEYYRGYVEFYCRLEDIDANMANLQKMLEDGELGMATLFMLAERAYKVHPAFPVLAYSILYMVVKRAGNNGVGKFGESLDFSLKAKEVYLEFNSADREKLDSKQFDLLKMEFLLMLETGMHKSPEIDSLLQTINRHFQYGQQEDLERQQFELAKVRLHFIRFSKQDELAGPEICKSLLQEDMQHTLRLRAMFYELKLVPSDELKFGIHEDWPKKAIEVNQKYKELISELEKIFQQDNSAKDLYREVLNDYAGSFLTDKILPVFDLKNQNSGDEKIANLYEELALHSGDQLFSEIESLLVKRIVLEQPSAVDKDGKLQFEELKKLIADDSESIDKRGLCYTLNYYARACKAVGKNQEALDLANLSYAFNTNVGDFTGMCTASGTAGYACMSLSLNHEAFNWFRKSFGHGWKINHYSRITMVMHMLLMSERLHDETRKKEAEFYAWQLLQLQLILYFKKEHAKQQDLPLRLLRNDKDLMKIAETRTMPQPYYQLGNSPDAFCRKLNIILDSEQHSVDGFHIERKMSNGTALDGFETMGLTMHHENEKESFCVDAFRLKGCQKWHMSKIEFKLSNKP